MRLLHRNMLLPFMGLPCVDDSEEEVEGDANTQQAPVSSSSEIIINGHWVIVKIC